MSEKSVRARIAAERLLEKTIADAMASYGEANWRQDLAPAIASRFGIYFDYDARRRRVMLTGPWEEDPYADAVPCERTEPPEEIEALRPEVCDCFCHDCCVPLTDACEHCPEAHGGSGRTLGLEGLNPEGNSAAYGGFYGVEYLEGWVAVCVGNAQANQKLREAYARYGEDPPDDPEAPPCGFSLPMTPRARRERQP